FAPGERGKALVGVDMARTQRVNVGKTLFIRGHPFEVVGIIEKTLTVRDNLAFIPLADAQDMLAAVLPPPLNANPYSIASEIEVYPKDLKQADQVAATINANVPTVHALAPSEVDKQFKQSLVI